MEKRFAAGDPVQTPFGKGVVVDVRNNGGLLVQIQQRSLLVAANTVALLKEPLRKASAPPDAATAPAAPRLHAASEVDLHGLRVEEALARIDDALDAALRASLPELRFIHGRSGGRVRGALHARLRAISAVRGLHVDPRNPGVTIVVL